MQLQKRRILFIFAMLILNAEAQKKVAQQTASEGMQKTVLPFDRPVGQQQNLVDDVQAWQQREALAVPTQPIAKPIMQSNSFGNSKAGDFESEADSSDLEKSMLSKEDQDFQSQVYGRLNSEWEPNKLPAIKADSSIAASPMSNVDKVKNMQNLIENAKILTQNGGGEMKMQLSPEGLGDMQLKVIVANGKVDLELKTQNHDVKKMMESTINELKSSLAQHSLSVDKIKVDVGAQDSTSSGDSFAKQFQMNDNREQARQFLGQFRENNFSQRNNMFDVPGFKTYQSQRGEDLEPVTNRPVRPRAMEANKGQGLNLVA
jgi:flagellar hook-length control protein FliK